MKRSVSGTNIRKSSKTMIFLHNRLPVPDIFSCGRISTTRPVQWRRQPPQRKLLIINPLTHGRFSNPYFKVLQEGVKQKNLIFLIGASATKSFARSKFYLKYGFVKDILGKMQKNTLQVEGLSVARAQMKCAYNFSFLFCVFWAHKDMKKCLEEIKSTKNWN